MGRPEPPLGQGDECVLIPGGLPKERVLITIMLYGCNATLLCMHAILLQCYIKDCVLIPLPSNCGCIHAGKLEWIGPLVCSLHRLALVLKSSNVEATHASFCPPSSYLRTDVPILQPGTACCRQMSPMNQAGTQARWSVKTQHKVLASSPSIVPVLGKVKDSRVLNRGESCRAKQADEAGS